MDDSRSVPANRRRFAALVAVLALTGAALAAHGGVSAAQTGDGGQVSCVVYWLQLGAFRDLGNAKRLVSDAGAVVAGDGGPALIVVQVTVGGAPLYRVLSGPHDSATADARRARFTAAGRAVSTSTSTVAGACPTATSAPAAPAPAPAPSPIPGTPVISAEPPQATVAGFQVQAGSFRSLDFAQRRAAELNAALGAAVAAGEFSVITTDVGGVPLHRVRSRVHARATADALLVLVRVTVPEAALVNV